jgi:hypothetical protein
MLNESPRLPSPAARSAPLVYQPPAALSLTGMEHAFVSKVVFEGQPCKHKCLAALQSLIVPNVVWSIPDVWFPDRYNTVFGVPVLLRVGSCSV